MKINLLLFYLCFCSLFCPSLVFSQLSLFSDLYIAPENEVYLASGNVYFESGNILTGRTPDAGTFSFHGAAGWENTAHQGHIDGFTRVYGLQTFRFPVGHKGVFQPLQIDNFFGAGHFDVGYFHQKHPDTKPVAGIKGISETHYWALRNPKGKGRLYLSWTPASNISQILGLFPDSDRALQWLTIGGFDGETWQPIPSELSAVSINAEPANTEMGGTIQSKENVDFSKYHAFSLMIHDIPESHDALDVYQIITPNGDGKNDTWIVDGIAAYPNARVAVYNRWGEEVFAKSGGYKNDWKGTFKNNAQTLPTGPYFFVIDLENDGTSDEMGWIYIMD